MVPITVEIKDSNLKFFKDLIQNFSFAKVREQEIEEVGDSDERIRKHLKENLEELQDILDGKIRELQFRTF